ncbi:MAG: tripartite tricarboxylate transporter substrate binding protein [Burkholderiales bacterium]|jgi:tripartite-type tricarboxylate transporter receptor subunit TctC|nr:tripartite tricarboxylate transporter substrate binding protein [Burkholderiales bacterium]
MCTLGHTLRRAFALLLLPFATALCAQAQTFPSKPIKILVPNPPGGPTDMVARMFGDQLQASLGQPVIIEYKPGANGAIVANATIASPADGYTIALSTVGGQVLTPAINQYLKRKQEPDVMRQLIPVSHLVDVTLAIVANPNAGFSTLPELVSYAKAHPGKLNFATTSVGASDHLGLEMYNKAVGIDTVHVPQKGFAGALNATLSGETHYWLASLNQQIVNFHKAGRLRILAVTSLQRSPMVPEIPTAAEASNLPGFEVSSWQALFVRAGTDKNVVATLSSEFQKAARDPKLIDRINSTGMITIGSSPEALATKVETEYRKWSDMLETTRITVN